MATLLYRLGSTAFRRWPAFIAGWLVLILGVGVVAATLSRPMNDEFSIPGIPSEKAAALQSELFPASTDAFAAANVAVVVKAPAGHTLSEPTYRRAVDGLVADLATLPQLDTATPILNPVDAAAAQEKAIVDAATAAGTPVAQARANAATLSPLSVDGSTGVIGFTFDVATPVDVTPETRQAVLDTMADSRVAGLRIEANGPGMQAQTAPSVTSEAVGIGVAILVLILTFGSLVAAGLPIITAVLGVALATTGITAMTAFMDLSSSTPGLASMIGLAVGIDYALFILARYRSELARGHAPQEAAGRAVGTAGSAVVFAGLTVMIALAALVLVRIPFLAAMGLAAAATVLIAVLVALTLVPAILGLLKSKAFGGRVLRLRVQHDEQGRVVNNGMRWAQTVGRSPVLAIVAVVVGLGTLAIPARDLHLAFPTDSTASVSTTQRQASDLVSAAFGPGREAPLVVVADGRDLPADARPAAYGAVAAWAGAQGGVDNAQVVAMNEDGTGAQILVTPTSGPDAQATQDLLTALRDGQSGQEKATGLTLGVTGLTAITTDVSARLSGALPLYLGVVIGLAFLLLMLVFRSILVPLTATLGFLLSVMATIGATVLIFQKGTFGLMEPTPIVSFMPVFLVGVVFGLAMDYQVFLVSRIREAYVHGDTARQAVVDGFRNSARVVTAAAIIMISVFAAFVAQPDPVLKSMGFALAVAVFLDAFVVRMTLIPALLWLMGDKAWWLPGWLDRLLPDVDIEGERLKALDTDGISDIDQDPAFAGA